MSSGEIAYLALVLFGFVTFMSVLGFISVWSRRPRIPTADEEDRH
jgi:hypothetical protein